MADLIEIPDFDFSNFYYPDILKALISFARINVPEITDESDEEPFTQMLRAFALIGHLNNVLLDVNATETLLPSARLLESIRSHLKLIDVTLEQNKPASVDIVCEFSKIFTTSVNFIPLGTEVATEETTDLLQIIFEANLDNNISATNQTTVIQSWDTPIIEWLDNSFDSGDKITIAGVDFISNVDFTVGATLDDTINNFVIAFNTSTNSAIENELFTYKIGTKTPISLLNFDITSIPILKTDTGTTNWIIRDGLFGINRAGEANTDGVFFDMFNLVIEPGSIFYIQHDSIMWDTLDFKLNTPGSNFTGIWEFYDGDFIEKNPNSVINLGSNLEIDLTDLLGTSDLTGTLIKITFNPNSAFEFQPVFFSGGVNKIITNGLLGQVTVSTDINNYLIGTDWNAVSELTDNTINLTQDGKISYSLPQNLTQNWIKKSINSINSFGLRFRIISITGSPISPSVNLLKIDKGKQFLLFNGVQGETKTEDPLGSSSGAANQEFILTFKPLFVDSLIIEINEGSGFTEWNKKDNFLTSTQSSKDYILEVLANDTAIIQFGDSVQGKIPTSGVDNIKATYRIGGDINGNVGALTITINKSGIAFVNRIFNPRSAAGHQFKEGSTESDLARLKIEGPATLRVRNRAITPDDYVFLLTQFKNSNGINLITRALAIEETFGIKTIELVVVGVNGVLLTQNQLDDVGIFFNGNKTEGIKGIGISNHQATVINYTPNIIDVAATIQGGNKEKIENVIKNFLNPNAKFSDDITNRWDFGSSVPTAIIIAEIGAVDPVNIKNIVLTTPATDVQLGVRELPFAGVVNITII